MCNLKFGVDVIFTIDTKMSQGVSLNKTVLVQHTDLQLLKTAAPHNISHILAFAARSSVWGSEEGCFEQEMNL